MKRFVIWAIGVLVAALLLIQLVPVKRTNPPGATGQFAPAEVTAIFQRSCYDCHSNETAWPWYSRVAPVSWLVADDVKEGREHLNFSNWDLLDQDKREKMKREIWEELEAGEMPLWFYLPLHPDARLSRDDLTVIRAWAVAAGPMG